MPHSIQEQENVIRNFRAIANIPTVIGAIGCTHVRIKKVGGDVGEAYINRKGYYSLNIQVVCDSNLKIRDIVARWRGSVHDSRIFNESALKLRFEQGEFHGRLLGDSGYACMPYMFTPLLRPNNNREEAYNRAHIQTWNTIERCFGLWKQMFRCLLRGLYVNLPNVKTTIVALAVLHNIAIDMGEATPENIFNLNEELPVQADLPEPRPAQDNLRGNVVRHRFIQDNF